jgi:hypothetical protein
MKLCERVKQNYPSICLSFSGFYTFLGVFVYLALNLVSLCIVVCLCKLILFFSWLVYHVSSAIGMYACMYVCITLVTRLHVCRKAAGYVCICMHVYMKACMYMYGCMYACTYYTGHTNMFLAEKLLDMYV